MFRLPAALACLTLAACTQVPSPFAGQPAALPAGDGLQILVAARSGPGADAMLPLPLQACNEPGGPVEITVSFSGGAGLASARVDYDQGGTIAPGSLRVTPAGGDIVAGRRGAPGDQSIEITVADTAPGRGGVLASFETAAPHTGTVSVTATDRSGETVRAGPFRLAQQGGCAASG